MPKLGSGRTRPGLCEPQLVPVLRALRIGHNHRHFAPKKFSPLGEGNLRVVLVFQFHLAHLMEGFGD